MELGKKSYEGRSGKGEKHLRMGGGRIGRWLGGQQMEDEGLGE